MSHNPDFTSILNVGGKIFSITQFESPTPGVAYLSELEQDEAYGTLTVSPKGRGRVGCLAYNTRWQDTDE